jgi:beta-xylosidase
MAIQSRALASLWPNSDSTGYGRLRHAALAVVIFGLAPFAAQGQAWIADRGDGTYRNPILHADYSDPDAIRVGANYYMAASSFDAIPGLPILHSKDLVNWELVGHALKRQPPYDVYDKPQHGNGVWAPTIRYHAGQYFIFYADPDYGIYMIRARHPRGPWTEPLLIKRAKGWIDPCPLWDDDGKAYLVSAMAASRSGIKSVLIVSRMTAAGDRLLDDGVIVFDGHGKNPTVEGPKFYKRNGYYYIFAPAGGVTTGWQLVLRSKSVYGPYESKVVLAQGRTNINGPHQGAWVDTPNGESWFLHFQDKGSYGRVVHLQPMKWQRDWPLIGSDSDGDGIGEPVSTHKKPGVGGKSSPTRTPPDSDDFNGNSLGLQWQWQANPQPNWSFPAGRLGFMRLTTIPSPEGSRNLWDVPNLLMQKFPAPEFTATTKLTFSPGGDGERAGLLIMGIDYAYLAIAMKSGSAVLTQVVCSNADRGTSEREVASAAAGSNTVYLRARVTNGAVVNFFYSTDGVAFVPLGEAFQARAGKWTGAKVGLFATREGSAREFGYADFDWFKVEPQ